jgi:quercetin dioxygenase-like cupin family protein
MRILDFEAASWHSIASFDSAAFSVAGVGKGDGIHLVTARLEPGGVIGRHPAVGRQLLVVLQGQAVVSGDCGSQAAIGPGQAALWEPGESHETSTNQGLLALLVEGELAINPQASPASPSG